MKSRVGPDLEQRLHLRAEARRSEAADPELGAILSLVADRRGARRAPPGGAVLSRTPVGPDIVQLRVARPSGFSFRAGQSVKLGVSQGPQRSYTLASAPSDPHLEFCIERIPGGVVSPRVTALAVGARVELGASPKGSLTFEPGAALHVMVATATGVAPFRSMLRELARGRADARVLLLHGASYADRLPYAEELAALAASEPTRLRYLTTVSRPTEPRNRGWAGATGRVDALLRDHLASATGRLQVYACGSSAMIAAASEVCEARGVPLKTEAFD